MKLSSLQMIAILCILIAGLMTVAPLVQTTDAFEIFLCGFTATHWDAHRYFCGQCGAYLYTVADNPRQVTLLHLLSDHNDDNYSHPENVYTVVSEDHNGWCADCCDNWTSS